MTSPELITDSGFSPGRRLGQRYVIDRLLAEGGMGRIYVAHQEPFGRRVAVKVLHAERAEQADMRERFLREAEIVSRLSHPNTVTVLDFGETPSRQLYLVMELVEGRPLSRVIADQGSVSIEDAVAFAVQIAQSLGEAHYKGIVHRDLKPDNVMVCEPASSDAYVKVLDFGIARLVEELGVTHTDLGSRTGRIVGTPQYMAPEQADGRDVDARTDLYALGCCLFEMLCGHPPFRGPNAMSVLIQHVKSDPPSLPDGLPTPLNGFVGRALAKDPADRPQDSLAFIAELMACFRATTTADGQSSGGFAPPRTTRRRLTPPRLTPPGLPSARARSLLFGGDAEAGEPGPDDLVMALSKTQAVALPFSGISPGSGMRSPGSIAIAAEPLEAGNGADGRPVEAQGDGDGPANWSPLWSTSVEVPAVSEAELEPALRQVAFGSQPDDALVFVDDVCIGTTPLSLRVPASDVLSVRFEKHGFEGAPPCTVTVDARRDNRVFAALEPKLFSLSVVSPVPGAQLLVQGRDHGHLPGQRPRLVRLAWPDAPLEIRLRHQDYEDHVAVWPSELLGGGLHHAPSLDDLVPRER